MAVVAEREGMAEVKGDQRSATSDKPIVPRTYMLFETYSFRLF